MSHEHVDKKMLSSSGILDAIIEIGEQRKDVLLKLRAALESGNNIQALNFARQLCGLDEKDDRTNSRLN